MTDTKPDVAETVYEVGKATVSFRYIKRIGLANWKWRELWLAKNVFIWSREHSAFWRANAAGYTVHATNAGIYDFADAYARTKHCGPEKKIEYHFFYAGTVIIKRRGFRDEQYFAT